MEDFKLYIKNENKKIMDELKKSEDPLDIELINLINYLKEFYDNEEYNEEYENYMTSLGYV